MVLARRIFRSLINSAACAALLFALASASFAQAPIYQPGAPGSEGRALSPDEAIEVANIAFSPADVRFMQDMILHHNQAVQMAALVGDRTNRQRQDALAGFTAGRLGVLVATDVAARGLHVPGIRLVVNYDLPVAPEDWVHRVGRAAHGGGEGG